MASTMPQATECDDPIDWLRLIRSRRVGAVTFHRLMGEHGSARAALAALPQIARAAGVDGYEVCPPGVAEAEMRSGRAFGARLLLWGGPDYPAALMDLLVELQTAPQFDPLRHRIHVPLQIVTSENL